MLLDGLLITSAQLILRWRRCRRQRRTLTGSRGEVRRGGDPRLPLRWLPDSRGGRIVHAAPPKTSGQFSIQYPLSREAETLRRPLLEAAMASRTATLYGGGSVPCMQRGAHRIEPPCAVAFLEIAAGRGGRRR
ncbi:hypothetical protein DAI22_07g177800 [Oryza sativa Japonica Group]|nr:hypothetical protein DAI22_07g177800 [Oryza sativa Japonica Group]